MDTLFLAIGGFLFIAWISGLLISISAVWRKNIGNLDLKHKIKRPFPINEKKKVYN